MTMSEQVRLSGLPLDQLVVIGSGLLDQLGLRQSRDVDLAVSSKLFEELRQSGGYTVGEKHEQLFLEKGMYEIWKDWGHDAPFEKLWHEGQTLDGIRFVATDFLIRWKDARGLEKDVQDIALLEWYKRQHRQIEPNSV